MSKNQPQISQRPSYGNNTITFGDDDCQISFSDEDLQGVQVPHNDALVIQLRVANFEVKRILVKSGSSANILFYDTYERMELGRDRLEKVDLPLYDLLGQPFNVVGSVELPITAGSAPQQSTIMVNFMVVKPPCEAAYDAILESAGLHALRAVASTYHLKMKFPTANGIGECKGDQETARQCHEITLRTGLLL